MEAIHGDVQCLVPFAVDVLVGLITDICLERAGRLAGRRHRIVHRGERSDDEAVQFFIGQREIPYIIACFLVDLVRLGELGIAVGVEEQGIRIEAAATAIRAALDPDLLIKIF